MYIMCHFMYCIKAQFISSVLALSPFVICIYSIVINEINKENHCQTWYQRLINLDFLADPNFLLLFSIPSVDHPHMFLFFTSATTNKQNHSRALI